MTSVVHAGLRMVRSGRRNQAAINDGDTEEYAALAATAPHHNALEYAAGCTESSSSPVFGQVLVLCLNSGRFFSESLAPGSTIFFFFYLE